MKGFIVFCKKWVPMLLLMFFALWYLFEGYEWLERQYGMLGIICGLLFWLIIVASLIIPILKEEGFALNGRPKK